jgi:uncharacterized tellurite resistance protein B-like protein
MSPELQTHFFNLYSMALSDSRFDENEVALLYKLAGDKGISRNEIDAFILNSASTSPVYPESLSGKIEYLYDYAKIILADGIVHEEEINTLKKFCEKFRFEEQHIQAIAELLIEAVRNNISKEEVLNFVTQNN